VGTEKKLGLPEFPGCSVIGRMISREVVQYKAIRRRSGTCTYWPHHATEGTGKEQGSRDETRPNSSTPCRRGVGRARRTHVVALFVPSLRRLHVVELLRRLVHADIGKAVRRSVADNVWDDM